VSGNAVEDVLIFDKVDGSRERVISARKARLRSEKDGGIVLELEGVWAQTMGKAGEGRIEYTSSSRMEYRVKLDSGVGSSSVIGPFEMSSLDLGKVIAEKEKAWKGRLFLRSLGLEAGRSEVLRAYDQAQDQGLSWQNARQRLQSPLAKFRDLSAALPQDRSIHIYKTEYYKKFAIPAGAACFVLLAYPLGLRARKAGRSVGFGLGLLIAVIYWALLLLGSTMSSRLGLSPFWSMWGPNFLMLAVGLSLWIGERLAR
jgi:lipopolysaccharide export system permease protein